MRPEKRRYLLRCEVCHRTAACELAEALRFADTAWPRCCDEVMRLFVETAWPGAEADADPESAFDVNPDPPRSM